jgi:hypothetical protein
MFYKTKYFRYILGKIRTDEGLTKVRQGPIIKPASLLQACKALKTPPVVIMVRFVYRTVFKQFQ